MSNDLTAVIPQLLAQGVLALRENAKMPMLVNRSYDALAGAKGSTIDVPVPSAISATSVTPGPTPPSSVDSTPTSVPIVMNRWKEAVFHMTDQNIAEAMDGFVPMQVTSAIKALANEIDVFILGLGAKFYGYTGTAGTDPFADGTVIDATLPRKTLSNQLAPIDDRRFVFNADAEANALLIRAFQDMSFSGSAAGIIEGQVNRKLGFDFFMDQNVPTHTAGTGASILVNDASTAVGQKVIPADGGTGTILVGDIVTFAGDSQTYVVTSALAAGAFSIEPGLQVAVADNAAITLKASHPLNLAFHRDAIAFATRPLQNSNHPASLFQSAVDSVSGLVLRLEVTREHRQDKYAFDVLYGAEVIRRELGTRVAGTPAA